MASTIFTAPQDWPTWIQALQVTTQQLRELVEQNDWAAMQIVLDQRNFLLRKALPPILESLPSLPDRTGRSQRDLVKRALIELLEIDRSLFEDLAPRRQDLSSRINQIKKGRKTLSLYKTYRASPPRFCDRFG